MTARDDHRELAVLAAHPTGYGMGLRPESVARALDEIDRLRADLATVAAERDLNAGIAARERATAAYYRDRGRWTSD